MTARLIDRIDLHRTKINHTRGVHLSIHTRVVEGARTYVQSLKSGPEWGHVVRRVTMNLRDTTVIQDLKIQDQPIRCTHNAPLPNGVPNICTRLYWEPPAPVLTGQEDQRPRPRR
eukprot:7955310-Pyramimonas_sp.AAC.1